MAFLGSVRARLDVFATVGRVAICRQTTGQQRGQSGYFSWCRFRAVPYVVAAAAWRHKPWWVTTPYPRLRCLVIPIPSSWLHQFLASRNWPLFPCLTFWVHSSRRRQKHQRKLRKFLRAVRGSEALAMHVLATELATLDEADVAIDLGQSP